MNIHKILLAAACMAVPASAQTPEPLTCLLGPSRVSDVGTDLRSIVAQVPVERADFVREGAALVQLDRALADADLRVAAITVQSLQGRVERGDRLAEGRLVPYDELEQLQTDLALAEADYARAQEARARTTIRAPFDGYVARVNVAEGELTGTDPLVQLIDVSVLKAEMTFLDDAFGMIEPGQELSLAVDLVGAEVVGRVTAIDPFLDAASNTFSVVAEVENENHVLPAGAGCRVIQPPG